MYSCDLCEVLEDTLFTAETPNLRKDLCEIVQHPANMMQRPVSVYPSMIHGYGLFATAPLGAGTLICKYFGEGVVIQRKTGVADRFMIPVKGNANTFTYVDGHPTTTLPHALLWDAETEWSLAGAFVNTCTHVNGVLMPPPNCSFFSGEWRGQQTVFIHTLRDIVPGEEIICDYHWVIEPEFLWV